VKLGNTAARKVVSS